MPRPRVRCPIGRHLQMITHRYAPLRIRGELEDIFCTCLGPELAPRVISQRRNNSVASLIGRSGSSTFRLSTSAVSVSLTGSCFSSESAPRPFHHGSRERGGTIFRAALLSDERQVQATKRTHLIHRPARDIFPP